MIFAIRNQNEQFLKFALQNSYFGSNFFKNNDVQTELLSQLSTKAKTEFILNILIFTDFSWSQKRLKEFIDCMAEIPGD